MIGNALPDRYHCAATDRQHDAGADGHCSRSRQAHAVLLTHDTVPRKLLPHLA